MSPIHQVSVNANANAKMSLLTIFAGGEAEDDAGGGFWVGVLDRKIRFTG